MNPNDSNTTLFGKQMILFPRCPLPKCHAFSLFEIFVIVAILSVLTVVSYPFAADFHIRSQVAKARLDLVRISDALQMYYADYNTYPNPFGISSKRWLVEEVYELTTPHAYMHPAPRNPWTGKMAYVPDYDRNGHIKKMEKRKQYDYQVNIGKTTSESPTACPFSNWNLRSGGPESATVNPASYTWYSPTNGTRSFGGFYLDSQQRTNVK